MKPQNMDTLVTRGLNPDKALKIPIAHGEGRFYVGDDELKRLNDNGQVLFRYCDADGNVTPESNPNGALDNIAGVTNAGKNVFGMMPHPERAADEELSNTDGRAIFESILQLVTA